MHSTLRKSAIGLSETGVGKSRLGCALVGPGAFTISDRPDSETKETIGKEGNFKGQRFFYIDTPGLNDSDGMDSKHVKAMVDYVKAQTEIHAVFIALNAQDPRLSATLQSMLKFFCYIFRTPQLGDNVCFVFTHSFRLSAEAKQNKSEEVVAKFKTIIASSGLEIAATCQIPCFFVNNADVIDDATDAEYTRLRDWLSTRQALPTDLLNHADPQFEKIEEEKQSVTMRTESVPIIEKRNVNYTVQVPSQHWKGRWGKITGQKETRYHSETRTRQEDVQTGTRTIKYWEEQKRVKKTTYSGQVVYTNWEKVKAWTEQC